MLSSSYKIILCVLRRLGSLNDKINAPIAGFFSALSLMIEAPGRKNLMVILVLSRACSCIIELYKNTGLAWLPKRLESAVLFMAVNLWLQSRMSINQSVLARSLYKFYEKWSCMNHDNTRQLIFLWERMYIDKRPGF